MISGTGGIIKDDTSTQEFSGANTYQGFTNINGGVLRVSNASGLGSAINGATVADGASLVVDGVTITDEVLTIAGSGAAGIGGALSDGGSTASYNGAITLT